jgi:hypothetical protein
LQHFICGFPLFVRTITTTTTIVRGDGFVVVVVAAAILMVVVMVGIRTVDFGVVVRRR